MAVGSGMGIVTGVVNMIQPGDKPFVGELIENPVDTFPGDCRQVPTYRVPDSVHIRVAQIAFQEFIYSHALRGTLPAVLPTEFRKIPMCVVSHDA